MVTKYGLKIGNFLVVGIFIWDLIFDVWKQLKLLVPFIVGSESKAVGR